jgi:hypothetical protein
MPPPASTMIAVSEARSGPPESFSATCWQMVRQSYEPVLTVGLNVLSSNLLASSSSCRLIVWGIPG